MSLSHLIARFTSSQLAWMCPLFLLCFVVSISLNQEVAEEGRCHLPAR
jgi:hypothetical protein